MIREGDTNQVQIDHQLIVDDALDWIESTTQKHTWRPLSDKFQQYASMIGVMDTDKIRICVVGVIPQPVDGILHEINNKCDLITDSTVGITFGYNIFVTPRTSTEALLHELVHVRQFEQCGSLQNFVSEYLRLLLGHGYTDHPMEIEARMKARELCRQIF